MFTIGNHLELAHGIVSYRVEEYETHLATYHEKYNIRTSANLYTKLLQHKTHKNEYAVAYS